MRKCAWLGVLGLSLFLGQNDLRADIAPPIVSSPLTNTSTPAVTMGWNPSPDTNVVGYYLAWGSASGQETNLIDVASVTNAVVSGFTTNVIYYFTIIAYDALGDQAPPSNEIQYLATNAVSVVPPSIVTDLTNQTTVAGSSISLIIGVTGTTPFGFQWTFNGAPLAGATSNPLTLNNVTAAQSGAYQVVVTNPAGSVTSSTANVAVLSPPTITVDLTNQTVAVGGNVALGVAVSGTGPLSYQWLFNGANLSGAGTDPLRLNNVSLQQAGTYQVMVSNAVGVATSAVALLTVLTPPTITGNPSNQTVAVGSSATFQVGVSGSSPFSYQWQFNGNKLVGATAIILSLNNLTSAQAGNYQVVAANAVGSATSAVAVLSVLAPPSIVVDLTNQSAVAGSTVSLSVGVAGSAPLGYQWLFDGTNMLGATTNPLVIPNFEVAQAGTYQAVVTNAVGGATSSVATVTALLPPVITADLTNETAVAGASVIFAVSLSGTGPFGYEWLFNGKDLAGAVANPLALNNLSSQQAGAYQLVATNSAGSVTSKVAVLNVLLPPAIVVDLTNQSLVAGATASLGVQVSGSTPLNYQWLFDGTNMLGATTNPLVLANFDSSQSGAYQLVVTNAAGAATSSVASLTMLLPPGITTDLSNQITAAGSSVSFGVGLSGSGPFSYEWFFNGTSLPGANTNPLMLNGVSSSQAGKYQVVVANALGSVTSQLATLSVLVPPSILVDLTNQTVMAGSPLSMGVQAPGTAPLTYQWLFNGVALSEATDNSLVLTNVSSAQSGIYQVAVTNGVGFAQSASATVTVLSPPSIVVDITNQTVASGSDVTFSLGVSGTTPMTFQWLYNGTSLPGATTNPLVLPKVSTSSAGTYQAVVSNALGTVQSATASLTVLKRNSLQVKSKTSTAVALTFAGVPVQTYTLQYSTNLSGPWQNVGSSTSDQTGILLYYVNETGPLGFYRIISP